MPATFQSSFIIRAPSLLGPALDQRLSQFLESSYFKVCLLINVSDISLVTISLGNSCRSWCQELNEIPDTCHAVWKKDKLRKIFNFFLCRKWILIFLLFSNLLMSHLRARIGILHVSFAQWCFGDPWFTAESCNMSCEGYSTVPGCDLALRCVIFSSSLVYTVKGSEKKYLKHQEVKSKGYREWAENDCLLSLS